MIWLAVFFSALAVLFLCNLFFLKANYGDNGDNQTSGSIYSKPGHYFYLKYFLIKTLMTLRQKRLKKKMEEKIISGEADSLMSSKFYGNVNRTVHSLEKKQVLPTGKPFAGDCIYFNASNSDGWYFTLGMAHRPNDIINLFFIVKIPGLGTFINPELPYCTNVPSKPCVTRYLTQSGFSVQCAEPMQEWRINFVGHLLRHDQCPQPNTNKVGEDKVDNNVPKVEANFDLVWTSHSNYFDFDVDIAPEVLAHSLSLEPWSRDMFRKLKDSHQSHYEQFGLLRGEFKLRGQGRQAFESGQVEMVSMRDHTITRFRNWSQLRRYIMMIYHLENGTCIHTSLISMPEVVFTHLQFGYVITTDNQKLAVDSIQLHLSDIGENKIFPSQFYYSFTAAANFYNVRVDVKDSISFKMGLDQACYVQEKQCEFLVNGVKGYGFTELEYRISPY